MLRVKGFAPAPAGGWLELNATAAGCTLAPIPQGQEVVIVIGEALDKAAIEADLKGERQFSPITKHIVEKQEGASCRKYAQPLLAPGHGAQVCQMIAEGKAGALRLTAVVCRSAGAQQWAKDTLPDTVRVCPSAEALYDHTEEFDAVLVVTPHKTHPALVMQAFAHGKHVLCDKPSANALAPALEMNRAAEKSGLVFAMMFHQRRYKKYMRLKKLLDDGALGEIKRVQLENSRYFRTWMYHRSGSWRSSWAGEGGGALLNQGQHILDIWQWLFGMPTSIYAVIPYGSITILWWTMKPPC